MRGRKIHPVRKQKRKEETERIIRNRTIEKEKEKTPARKKNHIKAKPADKK